MKLQITNPGSNQILHIDALGNMPVLRCEAQLLGDDQQNLNVPMTWSLQIIDNVWPARCESSRLGRVVLQVEGQSMGRGIWLPTVARVQGGDAVLTVTAQHQEEMFTATVNFSIRGCNPPVDAVLDHLGGEGPPAALLARHLSAFKQFDFQGMPLVGARGEVGMMRLCNPAASVEQRWSWRQNTNAGKYLLQNAEASAKTHLNQHCVNGRYPNDQQFSDVQVVLRETLQRYLGGAYWQWYESGQQWCSNPPDNEVENMLSLTKF